MNYLFLYDVETPEIEPKSTEHHLVLFYIGSDSRKIIPTLRRKIKITKSSLKPS